MAQARQSTGNAAWRHGAAFALATASLIPAMPAAAQTPACVATGVCSNLSGPGGLTQPGPGTLLLGGTNTYTGGTIVAGGALSLSGSMIGNLTIQPGATFVSGGGYAVAPTATLVNAGSFQSVTTPLVNQGTLTNSGTMLGGVVNSSQLTNTASGTIHQGITNNAGGSVTNIGTINGGLTNNSGGSVANSGDIHGGVINNAGGGLANSGTIHSGLVNNSGGSAVNSGLILLGVVNASQLTNSASGEIHEGVINNPGGAITNSGVVLGGVVNAAQLTNTASGTIRQGITNNAGGSVTNSGMIHGGLTNNAGGSVINSGEIHDGVINNSGGSVANSGTIHDGLVNNPGGSVVNSGIVLLGVVNASQLTNTSSGSMREGVVNNSGGSIINSGTITGGVVNNVGASIVNNGVVNGPFFNAGSLSGSGSIVGNVANAGVIAPGNSIGTLSITGNYAQLPGSTYQVEVNGSGQSDLIGVAGAAALQGGVVSISVQPGTNQAWRTTYRIVSATGALAGAFAATADPYPFLQPSLSYDANNAYLTLQIGGFGAAAANNNQYAVGAVLDANVPTATGDFAQVLSAMATGTFTNAQAQATLQALSGNNYSGFSSSLVQGAQLFMNNFANQTGGGGSPMSNRVALAEACDVACDTVASPKWGAWGGVLGGLGTVGAGQSVAAVTYNIGGFAAGLDRQITDSFRMGVTAGYSTGTQWVSGFDGLGRTDTWQAGIYGGFAQGKVYADAVTGYAYSYNQMWRNIPIPGLQQRTALGQTGVNQWYGQLETGYRVDLGTAADAFVTPFARLQAYSGTQNAFTESGAQSLNLTVAQQTTTSLRTVLGAQIGGAMDLGWREKLAMQFRLGWSHEFADVGRPVTATLAGAPAMPFTTWGVSLQRDGVVIGVSANTTIAEATSLYLRYEGDISGQDNLHAITAGVRLTW